MPSKMRMSGRSTMIDFAFHDIVGDMRIDRSGDIVLSRLDRGQKAQHRRSIVALGKALAVHDALGGSARRSGARSRRW